MVEYKKKKIQLKNGGSRNYYYKELSNGKKEQISKEVYLSKKGGSSEENFSNVVERLVKVGLIVPKKDGKLHLEEFEKIKSVYNNRNKLEKLANDLEKLPNHRNIPSELQNEDKRIINNKKNQLKNSLNEQEKLVRELSNKYKSRFSEKERILHKKWSNLDNYQNLLFEYMENNQS